MADEGSSVTIEVVGMDKLVAKLNKVSDIRNLVPAMKAGAEHIKGKLVVYPPASEANTPGQRRWYERGYGPFWTLKDGTVHSSKTSQMLNRSWSIGEENGGLTQRIGSNVTYGPYVMDDKHQASFHQRRGWKTIQTVAKEETAAIIKFIKDFIEKLLQG